MAEATETSPSFLADGAMRLCNRTWWVFLIGGIASVLFGVLAFANPGIALFVLAMFFAAYLLVDGVTNIWGGISQRDKKGWWALLLLGVLGVLIGGYALFVPPATMLAFVYVVGFMALLNGLAYLYLGWSVRKQVRGEWILYVTGILSVIFALLVFFRPALGGLYVVYLIAAWALVVGVFRIWFAFRARRFRDHLSAA